MKCLTKLKLMVVLTLSLLVISNLTQLLRDVEADPETFWEQIIPIDDAFVEKGDPDWNGGSQANLLVQHGSATPKVGRTFLKFNLSELEQTPLDAELRFFVKTSYYPVENESNIEIYELSNDTWLENTITWNNMPPTFGELIKTFWNVANGFVNKWWSCNVSDYVSNEYTGDKTLSFLLKCQDENETYPAAHGYELSSKEDSVGCLPELWIEYEGERDESTNPSFYDDFEDGSIDSDLWLTVKDTPTEADGKLNVSSGTGLVSANSVNVQNSLMLVELYNEGIYNWDAICLFDRQFTDIQPNKISRHDGYCVDEWRENQTASWWWEIRRVNYNESGSTLASDILRKDIKTTLQVNITHDIIYFDEIYNGKTYHLSNESYPLSTYWVYLYIYEDMTGNWTQYDSYEFRKLWLTDSLRQSNDALQNTNNPYISQNTHTIMDLSYTANRLIFDVDARAGVESTTKVSCASKGKPVKVSGATSWNYTGDVCTITVNHTSSKTVIVSWVKQASGYFLLTVHVTEAGTPLRDVTVTVHPLESIAKETHNASTGLTGLAQFELPYGTYLVKATHNEKVNTLKVWLTGNKDVGMDFGTPPVDPRGDLILILVFVVIIILYFAVFRRR
jgi:hypothetical protein